jgi:hypothetical protein
MASHTTTTCQIRHVCIFLPKLLLNLLNIKYLKNLKIKNPKNLKTPKRGGPFYIYIFLINNVVYIKKRNAPLGPQEKRRAPWSIHRKPNQKPKKNTLSLKP